MKINIRGSTGNHRRIITTKLDTTTAAPAAGTTAGQALR